MRTLLPTTLAALALASALAQPAQARPPAPGQHLLDWCVLNDGEMIDQPPGSPILMCCVPGEGCIMCDTRWENCEFDPAYAVPGARSNGIDGIDLFTAPSQPAAPGQATPLQQRLE
jgi:hypothetical protein